MIVVDELTGEHELPNLSFKPKRYGLGSKVIQDIQEVAILNDLRLQHAYKKLKQIKHIKN